MQNPNQPLEIEEENLSFIRKSGELSKLLKRVDKISPEAVALLEQVMNDPLADLKLRVACAKDLLAINIDVAKQVNQDNLNRLIAQLKLAPGKGVQRLVDKSVPRVDFSEVVEI